MMTSGDLRRPGVRRISVAAVLLLAATGIGMTACAPMAPPGPTGGAGAPPVAPNPTPTPTPPPENERGWALGPADFGDDDAAIWAETSNRSDPFAWDRITADNAAAVLVSIDGKELPLENTAYQPVFDADLSGAEWELKAEVTPGAVVLVLTAEDQSYETMEIASVTVTSFGTGYTSPPAVEFQGGGGRGATAVAIGPAPSAR